jgi:hypothetical protein
MTVLIRSKKAASLSLATIFLCLAVCGCSSPSSGAQSNGGASSGGEAGNAGGTGATGGNSASAGTGGGSAGMSASAGSGATGGASSTGGSSSGAAGTVGAQGGGAGAAAGPGGGSGGSAGGSPAATGTPLETLHITPTGPMAASQASLAKGELFLLRAAGAIDLGGTKVDAEFASTDGTTGMDKVGAVDVGLDDGSKELILLGAGSAPPMAGPDRMKWFGAFRPDHVYDMVVTGTGAPLALNLVKPDAAPAGTGSIDIAIYQLTPMPTGIGKSLETISVSVVSKTARSMSVMPTQLGAVYLLRSAGQGHVGGSGVVGDADFDDYNATATNANQGEGGADFGIGVDEGCTALHKLKWGPYRMDHDYFMLYAGTGMPISFSYCDTGYGDNIGSMPVDLYAVP